MSRWMTKRTFGLVDAHAERDGRDHDVDVAVAEGVLHARRVVVLHAGVIGQRRDARRSRRNSAVASTDLRDRQ